VFTAFHEAVEGIALDVVFGVRVLAEQPAQSFHVIPSDVSFIRSMVHRDAVCASVECDGRETGDIGNSVRARVTQRRDLVHVDRKFRHGVGTMIG
jgi:hypothetical protein